MSDCPVKTTQTHRHHHHTQKKARADSKEKDLDASRLPHRTAALPPLSAFPASTRAPRANRFNGARRCSVPHTPYRVIIAPINPANNN
jgi:hypothetical protein